MRIKGFFLLLALLASPSGAFCSTVSVDNLITSTLSATNDTITISSYVSVTAGSGLTLTGASGYITTGSSITASSFFGDGSHLSNLQTAALASTQTFSGSNSFTSSFTISSGGRNIVLSTSNVINNFLMSGSGVVSFTPEFHNSSSTIIPDYTTTATYLGPCVPGSTITVTTSGGAAEIGFIGTDNPFSNGFPGVSFLQDGSFVNDLSSTTPINVDMSEPPTTLSFSYVTTPTAGTHSYCLTIDNQFSTQPTFTVNLRNNAYFTNEFFFKELK